jgi:hypothetical protein
MFPDRTSSVIALDGGLVGMQVGCRDSSPAVRSDRGSTTTSLRR